MQIEVELTGIEGMAKSQVNRALKKANYAMGVRWRRRNLRWHFEEFGERKYRYAGRSIRYEKFKRKHLRHTHDLVFSGDGKREALGSKKVFATRDKVRIPLPRKFNFRATGSVVNMSKEIRAVTNSERKSLAGS